MKKIGLPIFLTLCVVFQQIKAQGTSTSCVELTFPKGAQTAALGSSNITATTLEAAALNPAALATVNHPAILLSSSRWIQETSIYSAVLAIPSSFGSFLFTVWTTRIPDIEIRTLPGSPEGTFAYHSSYVGVSYATMLVENLSLGVAGKYIFNKVYVNEFDGYTFDLGLQYPFHNLDVALAVSNIGSIEGLSKTNELPTTLQLGGSYDFPLLSFTGTFFLSVSSEIPTHRHRAHVGIEANYNNDLFFRVGYISGYDSRNFSLGCGFHYSLLHFDYAFVPFSYSLGDAHLVSIHFSFE